MLSRMWPRTFPRTPRPCLLIAAIAMAMSTATEVQAARTRALAQQGPTQQSTQPSAPAAEDARAPSSGISRLRLRGLTRSQGDNVRAQVALFALTEEERSSLTRGRLAYLLRRVPEEVRLALEPFGYYDPKVEVSVDETEAGLEVIVQVQRGEPVRVRSREIAVEGEARDDAEVQEALAEFVPTEDNILRHGRYESSKAAVTRTLAARGYFDAEIEQARIEVLRAEQAADIKLRWESGARYVFGEGRVSGSQLKPGLAERWLNFKPGEPFEQERLAKLHQRYSELDYFGFIDIRPEPDEASKTAPIEIAVVPAKRSIYTAGVSLGTDSGVGLKLGLDRRWVNDSGHKFGSSLDLAQRRSAISTLYRIPAFEPIEGWYQFGASYREEESDSVDRELLEAVASRSGRLGDWTLTLGLHAVRERYRIGNARTAETSGLSTLVYPGAQARYSGYDDPVYPTRGLAFGAELKVGLEAIGSDADFAQALVEARWVFSFGERNRLLTRGQLGRTQSDAFLTLPSTLRFFAGGDRSVRGYGYQEISPRDPLDNPIGGRNLATASVEYERMFTETWGAAVFVDAGNAFNRTSEGLKKGVGIGLRWRSPVGPVSVDIARGLDEPRDPWQLHIRLGPEL
jgi:translocation and assembly module TamA